MVGPCVAREVDTQRRRGPHVREPRGGREAMWWWSMWSGTKRASDAAEASEEVCSLSMTCSLVYVVVVVMTTVLELVWSENAARRSLVCS